MNKNLFQVSNRRNALVIGIVLFGLELGIFIFLLVLDASLAVEVLSMIAANHIVGRLAFIGTGLEFGLAAPLIIFIIIFHNTSYLIIVNSLMVFFGEKAGKLKFIRRLIESKKERAKEITQSTTKWSWLSISLFVWLPFPMTGAVMGSLIAYVEGYSIKDALLIVIPSMWIGVICWTLWLDELYGFFESFGKGETIFLTLFLVLFPFFYYLAKKLIKIRKA